jgi:hypothetical protein
VSYKNFPIVRGKRLRVTRLDECGNPPPPQDECALVVTKGFITVGLTAEVADGDDIEQKNADGDLCISDKSRDQFKRWNLEAEFCEVDPALLSLVSNVNLEEDWNSDVVGIRTYQGAPEGSFALEVWAGIPGTDCLPGEPTNYGYLLLPFVIPGVLGDITIENGAATFSIGGHTRGAGGWGVGPYDVVPTDALNTPGPLSTVMGPTEHHLLRTTTIAPPDPAVGCLPMPDYDTGEGGE